MTSKLNNTSPWFSRQYQLYDMEFPLNCTDPTGLAGFYGKFALVPLMSVRSV